MDPLSLMLSGFNKINSVSPDSVFYQTTLFGELTKLWKEADKKFHDELRDANVGCSLSNTIEQIFKTTFMLRKQTDRIFQQDFVSIDVVEINKIWEVFSDYQHKEIYDPKIRNEILVRVSKIV
jgi:hypothetical protein